MSPPEDLVFFIARSKELIPYPISPPNVGVKKNRYPRPPSQTVASSHFVFILIARKSASMYDRAPGLHFPYRPIDPVGGAMDRERENWTWPPPPPWARTSRPRSINSAPSPTPSPNSEWSVAANAQR